MLGLMGFSGSLPLYVIHRYYIFVFIDRANKDACLLACLITFNSRGFGGNDSRPLNRKFSKIPSDTFRRDTDSRVMAKFGENRPLGCCRKSSDFSDKKNIGSARVVQPPFAPTRPIAPKIS